MDIIEHKRVYFVKSSTFHASAPMEAHMAQNNTEMRLWSWNAFVYNIIETPFTHWLRAAHQSRNFRRSNAAFMHHRIKDWWTIQDILWHT